MRGGVWLKIIIKLGLAIICALIAWELILENFVEKSSGAIQHPILGRIYKEGTFTNGTEGFSRTHFNSLGMRNQEITIKKKNEKRIIILGDSYTEGVQVSDEKTFAFLLEDKFKKELSSEVNVINAGRSGASPAYYIHLAKFYNQLRPNYVVIQINDTDFTSDLFDKNKYFYLRKKDNSFETVPNKSFRSTNPLTQKYPQFDFLNQISIVRIGVKNLQLLLNSGKANSTDQTLENEDNNTQDYQSVIDWTLKELKKRYGNVVLVYLPKINYKELDSNKDTETANLLKIYSKKNKTDLIDMKNDFLDYFKRYHQPVNGFNNTVPGSGHINEIGHHLVANRIKSYFERSELR